MELCHGDSRSRCFGGLPTFRRLSGIWLGKVRRASKTIIDEESPDVISVLIDPGR
jgi:hypothetical protein